MASGQRFCSGSPGRHTFRTLGADAGVPLEVMMAQLGHMDRETSLEYVHIQQRALEKAKQLIESEQTEILAAAEGRSIELRMPQKKFEDDAAAYDRGVIGQVGAAKDI